MITNLSLEEIIKLILEFGPEQCASIIAAVITASASIVMVISNRKWNKKKIDADLKAKARIDWIQSVREHTADLFAAYYGILKETNKDNLLGKMQEAKKHSDILILYFGAKDGAGKESDKNILEKDSDNEGKNDAMVRCISELFKRINQYSLDFQNNKEGLLEKIYDRKKKEMYENPKAMNDLGSSYTEHGDEIPNYEPVFDSELEKSMKEAETQLNDYKESISEIHGLIDELRDYMRLYLKIEWDIAKNGN